MKESGTQKCDFCGAEEMSNTILHGRPTVEYLDGPPRASVPSTVLCSDCAQDVSDYLEARNKNPNQTVDGRGPFEDADAQAILERLMKNKDLVMEFGRGSGYGIRYVDNEWKYAVFRAPGPATIETLTQKEVQDRILRANRLTLKQFDPSAWERFELGR
jgi:hypothetical protein